MTEPITPLCLILMPFDKRKDFSGRVIDFDAVYRRLVVPAVEEAGLQPVRGDEGRTGSIDPHFLERLMLCEYVLADLTTADASIFYALGARHAVKPKATVLIYASGRAQLPFDVRQVDAVPYRVSPLGQPEYEAKFRTVIAGRLTAASGGLIDSPMYRLIAGYPELPPEKLDAMVGEVEFEKGIRKRLSVARLQGGEAVKEVESSLGNLSDAEPGIVLELFFSYRQARWWSEMVDLVPRMPPVLASTPLVQEQLGLALNRMGKGAEAEQVLRELIAQHGPSATSYGKLGRALKYQWERAIERGETVHAKELLDKAATAYLKGFESDWRDMYCGVNAVTLMELKQPVDPRRREILPVVYYAVEQRIRTGVADYWDYATLLELAVLSCDEAKGTSALGQSLARVREAWEPQTTAKKLRLIREARAKRGAECPAWADYAVEELVKAAARGTAKP